eukprot:gene4848-biopygen4765
MYSVTPSAQMSFDFPDEKSPRQASGERNRGVPPVSREPSSAEAIARDTPKSASLTVFLSEVMRMFSGLMSLWMMLQSWRYCSPSTICAK